MRQKVFSFVELIIVTDIVFLEFGQKIWKFVSDFHVTMGIKRVPQPTNGTKMAVFDELVMKK